MKYKTLSNKRYCISEREWEKISNKNILFESDVKQVINDVYEHFLSMFEPDEMLTHETNTFYLKKIFEEKFGLQLFGGKK